jgi:hypothetical protein
MADRVRPEDCGYMTSPDRDAEQLAVAGRLVHAVVRRATVAEAVGVMRCWQRCDTTQARRTLTENVGCEGQEAEAVRMAAIIDALADGRTDPEWDYGSGRPARLDPGCGR